MGYKINVCLILPDVLNTISRPSNLNDITVSPSSCTERIPSSLRALFPSAASARNLAAASFGIDNVTRTLFHGSTLNVTIILTIKTIFEKLYCE